MRCAVAFFVLRLLTDKIPITGICEHWYSRERWCWYRSIKRIVTDKEKPIISKISIIHLTTYMHLLVLFISQTKFRKQCVKDRYINIFFFCESSSSPFRNTSNLQSTHTYAKQKKNSLQRRRRRQAHVNIILEPHTPAIYLLLKMVFFFVSD